MADVSALPGDVPDWLAEMMSNLGVAAPSLAHQLTVNLRCSDAKRAADNCAGIGDGSGARLRIVLGHQSPVSLLAN